MPIRLRRDARIERLREIPLLAPLTKDALATIADVVVEQEFEVGGVLTREGHTGATAFVLVEGQAAVSRGGRELARLGPGEVIGELSLLDPGPRSATVTAATPLQVLTISADDFHKVLESSPALSRTLLQVLARRVRDADGQLAAEGPAPLDHGTDQP